MSGFSYEALAGERAKRLVGNRGFTLLAIETSCDETAASVLTGPRNVLGSAVHTQIPLHVRFGGVVPEIASRSHVERIGGVVRAALGGAGIEIRDVDAIAVTCGPGLVGALLVGVSYAKGLALAMGLPIVGVNHISGHVAANYLSYHGLEPPFICLIASGGHSHIVRVSGYGDFELLGRTRDDAAGEAFDKVARSLGLPYPGGPELEKLAKAGDPCAYKLHAGFNAKPTLDFSFSGIKTAVVNILHNASQRGESVNSADLAASFQRAVVDTLVDKTLLACERYGETRVALAGGVSANALLRDSLARRAAALGFEFYRPDMRYCTDNAAMIGCAGYYMLMAGHRHGLDLNAEPSLAPGETPVPCGG